jgi:hypothetical protein
MNSQKEQKKIRKPSAWLLHVKLYREKHPNMSYKDCLKNAKDSYIKVEKKKEKKEKKGKSKRRRKK